MTDCVKSIIQRAVGVKSSNGRTRVLAVEDFTLCLHCHAVDRATETQVKVCINGANEMDTTNRVVQLSTENAEAATNQDLPIRLQRQGMYRSTRSRIECGVERPV